MIVCANHLRVLVAKLRRQAIVCAHPPHPAQLVGEPLDVFAILVPLESSNVRRSVVDANVRPPRIAPHPIWTVIT